MRLVYTRSGDPVKVGDVGKTSRGDKVKVTYFREPHSSASEGKVTVQFLDLEDDWTQEFYVSIIGAEWIEREDRGWKPPKYQVERIDIEGIDDPEIFSQEWAEERGK